MKTPPLSFERILGFSASAIALAALGVSLWSGFEQRAHNKLTLRPYLTIDALTFKFAENTNSGFYLSNAGSGPAIIEEFSILVDDQLMDKSGFGGWNEAMNTLSINVPWVYVYYPETGMPVRAGDRIALISLSESGRKSHTQVRASHFAAALRRMRIQIKYKSASGESFDIVGYSDG